MNKNNTTCFLCGGKVRNGICTECGMDNRKSDEGYGLNISSCDNEPLTHVHVSKEEKEEQDKKVKKTAGKTWNMASEKNHRTSGTENKTAQTYYQQRDKSSSGKKAGKWVVIVVALIGILPSVAKSAIHTYEEKKAEKISSMMDSQDIMKVQENISSFLDSNQEQDSSEEYDPYQNVEDTIPAEGEHYETVITAGFYQVGLDLPEGVYTFTLQEGSGYLNVDDRNHSAYQYKNFGEKETTEASGIKLFQGSSVKISGGAILKAVTDNAQLDAMKTPEENPLTEDLEIQGEKLAGSDFPAGVYDISAIQDYGLLELEIPVGEENPMVYTFLLDSEHTAEYPEYSQEIKQVYLPEGAMIFTEELKVKLVPSKRTTSLDSKEYYAVW